MPTEFRGKSLEASFFARANEELLEKLRAQRQHEAAAKSLSRVCGIEDRGLLDRLLELEIGPETWAALALVPLVEVAWADGKVDRKERRAVLASAEANGVTPDTPSYELLEGWLEERPDSKLLQAWGESIVDLCARLSDAEREALARETVGRARAVAEAAGGILGLGNRVSAREAVVLAELEKAFG